MTMTPENLRPWLGPAWDDLTAEQIERLCVEADRIDERHPGEDAQDERDAALSAAVQYLLGETSVEDAGRALRAARTQLSAAMAAAKTVAAMTVGDGAEELATSAAAGIDRMTLRRALGKL